MYIDSLGNRYSSLPPRKANGGAKPSKGGARKIGRSKRAGEWKQKVRSREAQHRARGQVFTSYPC